MSLEEPLNTRVEIPLLATNANPLQLYHSPRAKNLAIKIFGRMLETKILPFQSQFSVTLHTSMPDDSTEAAWQCSQPDKQKVNHVA